MKNNNNNTNNRKHIVTYIDYGDGADGRPRALGAFNNLDDARKAIEEDMKNVAKDNGYKLLSPDTWEVWYDEGYEWEWGCVWNINEIEL